MATTTQPRHQVSRDQAATLVAAIRERFRAYIEADSGGGPELVDAFDRDIDAWGAEWVVLWEEGPFEWALTDLLAPGEVDEEMTNLIQDIKPGAVVTFPGVQPATTAALQSAGIFYEPGYSYTLLVYPASSR